MKTRSQTNNKNIIPSAKSDFSSIVLLVILYLLQGVPLGLTMGSIPFLLKSRLSYSDLALFSLASYPYSLKLIWSPIVDSIYWKQFGRRKSWIVPIQLLIGIALLVIGSEIDDILNMTEIPINYIVVVFTILVFLCATQDIAVDGWALSLLTDENKTYASTAQTIGLNSGYFLSFTVFLALNSKEFCNSYLRTIPNEVGSISLGGYLVFWGWAYLICTLGLILLKTESPEKHEDESVSAVYGTLWKISKLKR